MSDPIASLRALHERWRVDFGADQEPPVIEDATTPDYERVHNRLIVAMYNNLPALLDAAELLRTIRGVAFADEIDAVLSRLHVEDQR